MKMLPIMSKAEAKLVAYGLHAAEMNARSNSERHGLEDAIALKERFQDLPELTPNEAVTGLAGMIRKLADVLEETISQHIYQEDEEPLDCPERKLVAEARALATLAEAGKPIAGRAAKIDDEINRLENSFGQGAFADGLIRDKIAALKTRRATIPQD
jgi:hypothetical protein